ncbi:hypothetical protein [Nonomuraea sp. NPDC050310]|uniref:hypothetical protein n=1 Tax=unclassified Nonomuraea TaxID=2593643 RepID=UPI0033C5A9E4
MSSKSRQSREQHEQRAASGETERVTPKPSGKVKGAAPPRTELTTEKRSRSHRIAKDSLPLRRGQRGGRQS